jgi:hypothetical protein
MNNDPTKRLDGILARYQASFSSKEHGTENDDLDPLMMVFGITPELKRENRQYWGRELGMCWQLLVSELCKSNCTDFKSAIRCGDDEPCDLVVGVTAIDTKYRIGSGDSGTLKKFKSYGPTLRTMGLSPLLLIVREDNLPAAITACRSGGWEVKSGVASFMYLQELTGFDMLGYLKGRASGFRF